HTKGRCQSEPRPAKSKRTLKRSEPRERAVCAEAHDFAAGVPFLSPHLMRAVLRLAGRGSDGTALAPSRRTCRVAPVTMTGAACALCRTAGPDCRARRINA